MSEKGGQIVVIDDDEEVLLSAEMLLEEHFGKVHTMTHPQGLKELIQREDPDVILLDMNFSRGKNTGEEGLEWMEYIGQWRPYISVVPITAYGDTELVVQTMKKGAFDFVVKPWKNAKLLATALSARRYSESLRQNEKLESTRRTLQAETNGAFDDFIGSSPAIGHLKEMAAKVAPTEANILIRGENGTGKELLARHIHQLSHRRGQVFLPVDLGAISESLFESELFGHVKGAFTDAKTDKAGRFELASGGTVFLDEIGNLPDPLQAKLLTVLQNRQISRVGSARMLPVDFRLIAATNSPIDQMISTGAFRLDLYYRVNTFEIRVPPLRERKADIPEMAGYFLDKLGKKYGKPGIKLTQRARGELMKHSWPGNIRELKNVLERAVILSDKPQLDPSLLSRAPKALKEEDDLNLEKNERKLILQALDRTRGNISRAARELGINRNALYRRLKKHGLQ
mgnify:CR=1 FL=1